MAEVVQNIRSFKGKQLVYKHKSDVLNCEMSFGVYIPDHEEGEKLPALLYLSGLTCTHANVMEKSGMQQLASKHRVIFIHPDTSPRGVDLPGDSDSWDFGKGAGFYVDAAVEPWSAHYKMYSYVSKELPALVKKLLPIDEKKIGILGHSMGGHGAITVGLRNPEVFASISAFAPICHPTNCSWGKKAFSGYLGNDEESWKQYDASLLIPNYKGPRRDILIDQGEADSFLTAGQLQPEAIQTTEHVFPTVRIHPEYDHSYYFIATFLEDHFRHHLAHF